MKARTGHVLVAVTLLAGLTSLTAPSSAANAVTFGAPFTLGSAMPYEMVEPAIAAHPASPNVLYVMSTIPSGTGVANKIWRLNVASWSPTTVAATDFDVIPGSVDVDIAVGPDTDTDPATATVYAAPNKNLVKEYPVDGTGAQAGTASSTSLLTPVIGFMDRQWLAAGTNGTVHANWQGDLLNPREYYAAVTKTGGSYPASVTGELVTNVQRANSGPVAVNGTHAFIAYPAPGTINVARRELASPAPVWTSAVGGIATTNEFFPVVGVAGNKVYVTWSDGLDVYFAASYNNGLTFGQPQRVAEEPTERVSTFPTLVVAPSGAVAVAYYEGDGNPNVAAKDQPASTAWHVKVAVNTDPLGGGTWDVSTVNPTPVHHGSISAIPLFSPACTSDTQPNSNQLAELFEITRTADGHLALAYPTDAPGAPECDVILTVSIQTGGTLLV